MKQKILSFIVCKNKFLILENNPKNSEHGGDFWFTVTGELEGKENYEEAVAREIKEETGLNVNEIFDLNWGSIYNWNNEICRELNFISFVKSGKVILNEENVGYKWLDLDKFVETIKWDDDKKILKKVLEKAMKKELFFKEKKIEDYRR